MNPMLENFMILSGLSIFFLVRNFSARIHGKLVYQYTVVVGAYGRC